MIKRQTFDQSDLIWVGLWAHWKHTVELMKLANDGVEGARHVAQLALDRYFERLDEKIK